MYRYLFPCFQYHIEVLKPQGKGLTPISRKPKLWYHVKWSIFYFSYRTHRDLIVCVCFVDWISLIWPSIDLTQRYKIDHTSSPKLSFSNNYLHWHRIHGAFDNQKSNLWSVHIQLWHYSFLFIYYNKKQETEDPSTFNSPLSFSINHR